MNKQMKIIFVAFCAVIGCMGWALAYGVGLAVFFKDSRILHLTITSQPFAPFVQLWYYGSNPVLQKVAAGAMLPAVAATAIIAYAGLRKQEQPLGEAAFQTIAELRRAKWFRKDGHIFGKIRRQILRVKDDRHHLVIGPTRSGKGAGYVIPNALAPEGSMLVTDLKGEIFNSTASHRQRAGNKVFLFAPGQKNSHRWNPMDFIRSDSGDRTTDIQNMAKILVPKTSSGDGAFWQQMAQRIAAGFISYIHESDFYEGRRNLSEINALLNSGVPVQVLLRFIMEKEPYLSRFTRESFGAYIGLPEKTAGSALTELQNALEPFQNERIVAATSSTDIDISMMNRKPMSIYLAPNITDITLLQPLLTLFVQQVLNQLMLEHNPRALPVYCLLDEFRQLKKMDEVMTKLPYVAGYNIKFAFIIQDLKNLDEIYGENSRQSLTGNCGYQLILGANDQATADYVSKALGRHTIRYQSVSRSIEPFGFHKRTKVEQIRERELMMPQEVRKMARENLVLLVEGQSPIFADKLEFFKTQPFKSAVERSLANPPYVPETEILPSPPVPALTEEYENAGEHIEAPWKRRDDKRKPSAPALAEPERANPKSAVVSEMQGQALNEVITEDGEIIEAANNEIARGEQSETAAEQEYQEALAIERKAVLDMREKAAPLLKAQKRTRTPTLQMFIAARDEVEEEATGT